MTPVVLALAGAACYGVAAVLQHQAAQSQPPELAMRLGLLVALLRHPRWLLGNVLDAGGYAFQLLALRTGPLTLVEPLMVVSLIFAFPAGALLGRRRVSLAETGAAAVVAGGLGLFLAVARPGTARPSASALSLAVLSALTVLAVGSTIVLARRSARSRAGLLMAVGGGLAFSYMAAMTSLTWVAVGHGFLHAFTAWELYALVLSGATGIMLTQGAFHSGLLRLTLPTMTAVQPLAAIAIGLLVFGEHVNTAGLAPLWEGVGLVVMVVGVFALAQPEFPA